MSIPKCFLSYSWDSEEHKNWVRNLAKKLQANGVQTFLDQWDIHPGLDILQYMEESILDSDYVIMVCTPKYAEKANRRMGGVGYESSIITVEVYEKIANPGKFIPVLRGNSADSRPSFIKSRAYIDFQNDMNFNVRFEELLRHIHKKPRYSRPTLGVIPILSKEEDKSVDEKVRKETITDFKVVYHYAYSSSGMDLTRPRAEAFTKKWTEEANNKDFEVYKEAYSFAYRSNGMNLTRSGAEAFAWSRILRK